MGTVEGGLKLVKKKLMEGQWEITRIPRGRRKSLSLQKKN